MTDASSALAALALAVRERLLVGGAAALPGLGTLARTHVPARVQTRPDGQRVLLPPGETVTLTAATGDAAPLAALVVRHQGIPQAEPMTALRAALDQLEARLAATGEAQLAGVGAFQRTSGGVRFAVAPDLLGAVNRPFAGLPPVHGTAGTAALAPPPAPVEPPVPPPVAPLLPPTTAPLTPMPDLSGEVLGVPVLSVGEPVSNAPIDAPESPPDVPAADPDRQDDHGVPTAPVPAPPLADDLLPADGAPDIAWPASEDPTDDDLDLELERLVEESLGTLDPPTDASPPHPPSTDDEATEPHLRPEWIAASTLPTPDPLGAPDPIEDAEFSVVGAPTSDAPPVAGPASDAPATLPEPEAGRPLAPGPKPAPPVEAPRGTLDRGRSRWQAAMGWLLIAAALGALSALWILTQADARRDAAMPSAPAAPAPQLPAPTAADPITADSVADEPDGDTLGAARGDAPAAALAAESAPDRPAPRQSDALSPSRGPTDATRTDGTRALGRAPERGQAILPPRLAGLDAADAQALAGRAPVDPSRGGYTWVVLSTPSDADANALAARYRISGYRTGIVEGDGTRRWRVAVGQFESREQALRLRDRLPPQAPPDTWPLSLR